MGMIGVAAWWVPAEFPYDRGVPRSIEPSPAIVWCRLSQTALARAIVRVANLTVEAAGGPIEPDGHVGGGLAGFEGAPRFDDLRSALATSAARVALLLAPLGGSASTIEDEEVFRLARARDLTILTVEPVPSSIVSARSAEHAQWAQFVRFMGLFRAHSALASTPELLTSFGPVRTLSVSFRSGSGQGSLGARLFDAMHTVRTILGVPDSIDAANVTPVSASGVRLASAESLRALAGDLTANLRFAGAHAASISLSDRAGRWFRGVALVGENGCIRMDESGVERLDGDGALIEQYRPRSKPRSKAPLFEEASDIGAVAALGDAARRALDPHAPHQPIPDLEGILAMCEATLLSARTGQPESPETVLRMV